MLKIFSFVQQVAELEKQRGGRLGVAMLRAKNNTWYTHCADELFAPCSVFKSQNLHPKRNPAPTP